MSRNPLNGAKYINNNGGSLIIEVSLKAGLFLYWKWNPSKIDSPMNLHSINKIICF